MPPPPYEEDPNAQAAAAAAARAGYVYPYPQYAYPGQVGFLCGLQLFIFWALRFLEYTRCSVP